MAYSVTFTPSAEKSLAKLDRSIARRLKPKVLALADSPRPTGCLRLAGHSNLYRIRVGDYRIVYRIDDPRHMVEITIVAHRREVYRDL